jgi:hypothetical protein
MANFLRDVPGASHRVSTDQPYLAVVCVRLLQQKVSPLRATVRRVLKRVLCARARAVGGSRAAGAALASAGRARRGARVARVGSLRQRRRAVSVAHCAHAQERQRHVV